MLVEFGMSASIGMMWNTLPARPDAQKKCLEAAERGRRRYCQGASPVGRAEIQTGRAALGLSRRLSSEGD
jgi:hypothetical protein